MQLKALVVAVAAAAQISCATPVVCKYVVYDANTSKNVILRGEAPAGESHNILGVWVTFSSKDCEATYDTKNGRISIIGARIGGKPVPVDFSA